MYTIIYSFNNLLIGPESIPLPKAISLINPLDPTALIKCTSRIHGLLLYHTKHKVLSFPKLALNSRGSHSIHVNFFLHNLLTLTCMSCIMLIYSTTGSFIVGTPSVALWRYYNETVLTF